MSFCNYTLRIFSCFFSTSAIWCSFFFSSCFSYFSFNTDLVFTAEIPEDFKDNKLPTLDFLLWLDKNGLLNWSYYQKSMKTPLVIMDKSAMSDKQRHNILANELIRRLSNTNIEQPDIDETTNIIEIFTQQLKSSGYGRKTSREIVVAGTVG